jgi:mRNA-degrading endonuclease RelE of RelBE toxin-antitoxin system
MDRSEKGLLDESTPGLKNRYPAGIKKLEGDDQIYRLRVGD